MKIKSVIVQDHSADVLKALGNQTIKALYECGLVAEGNAKLKCPVDTGNLRNSITCTVVESEDAVYIGTNVEYAPYVEFGTGKFYESGRQTGWTINGPDGSRMTTRGQKAKPFLRPALSEHIDQYRKIIQRELGADASF